MEAKRLEDFNNGSLKVVCLSVKDQRVGLQTDGILYSKMPPKPTKGSEGLISFEKRGGTFYGVNF